MNGNTKLEKLKKKLFIIGVYLLVAAGMLVYVSYSQYRISIKGTVAMPQAYNVQASIFLGHTLTSDGAIYVGHTVLKDLSPGCDAASFAGSNDANHKITVSVNNSEGYEDPTVEVSPLDLTYKIYIRSTGRLPLEFVTSGPDGKLYKATAYTGNNETELTYRFTNNGTEPAFTLTGGAFSKIEHNIYVGWDTSNVEFEDAAFRKEVDELMLVAELVAEPMDHESITKVDPDKVWQLVEAE